MRQTARMQMKPAPAIVLRMGLAAGGVDWLVGMLLFYGLVM